MPNTPEKPFLDHESGLSPLEKEEIKKRNDIEGIYKDTWLKWTALMNEIMNNFHMENKGKINDTFLNMVWLKIADIESTVKGDIDVRARYEKYDISLEGKKLNLSDKWIALTQALAEDCVKNLPAGPVKDRLIHTDYFTSHKDIDGYMGPNTTLLLWEIAKAKLEWAGWEAIPFDGTITPELIMKMYKQCNPEFKPTKWWLPKSPEQQKEQEQSNLDQKKVLETILAALDALAPNGKLTVKEEWKKALGNVFPVVPTELTKKAHRLEIQSQWNYFDALEKQKVRESLELVSNYTIRVNEWVSVLSWYELLKNTAGKNDVEIAADGTMKVWVIDKKLPQPAPGVDQKLFQLQFTADGKSIIGTEYSSSVEDVNRDGKPDFTYLVDGIGSVKKDEILLYRSAEPIEAKQPEEDPNKAKNYEALVQNARLSKLEISDIHSYMVDALKDRFTTNGVTDKELKAVKKELKSAANPYDAYKQKITEIDGSGEDPYVQMKQKLSYWMALDEILQPWSKKSADASFNATIPTKFWEDVLGRGKSYYDIMIIGTKYLPAWQANISDVLRVYNNNLEKIIGGK